MLDEGISAEELLSAQEEQATVARGSSGSEGWSERSCRSDSGCRASVP